MGDDRAGTDGYIAPNSYTRAYRNIAAYPYIVAHMDGLGIFQPLVALFHVEWMTGCIERTARSDEDIIAKGNLRLVEDDTIGIGEEMIADLYVIAIVAEERCHDNEALTGLSEELLQSAEPLLTVVGRYSVYLKAFLFTTVEFIEHLRVMVGIIEHASLLFFFLCHFTSFILKVMYSILRDSERHTLQNADSLRAEYQSHRGRVYIPWMQNYKKRKEKRRKKKFSKR